MKFNFTISDLSEILNLILSSFSEAILLNFYIHFTTIFRNVIFLDLFLVSFSQQSDLYPACFMI